MAAKKKRGKPNPDTSAAVARVLDKGESTAAVADELGIDRQRVYAAVSRERARRAKAGPRKAGIRQGKALPLNGAGDNPFQIGITGLRDFIRHEVKAQLPAAVAEEMSKRFGSGS